jgi:hypothetical protein
MNHEELLRQSGNALPSPCTGSPGPLPGDSFYGKYPMEIVSETISSKHKLVGEWTTVNGGYFYAPYLPVTRTKPLLTCDANSGILARLVSLYNKLAK